MTRIARKSATFHPQTALWREGLPVNSSSKLQAFSNQKEPGTVSELAGIEDDRERPLWTANIHRTAASWEDQENNRLESQLADIVADLMVAGEAAFRQSLVEEQEWMEEERRQRLAELEAERFEHLKRSGELLREAQNIRALVANVRAAVLAGAQPISAEDLAQWETWASAYADRVDPVVSGQVMSQILSPSID
jgi:hypothetical protein